MTDAQFNTFLNDTVFAIHCQWTGIWVQTNLSTDDLSTLSELLTVFFAAKRGVG